MKHVLHALLCLLEASGGAAVSPKSPSVQKQISRAATCWELFNVTSLKLKLNSCEHIRNMLMTQFYSDDKMTNHKSHNRDTKCQQNDKSMVVPKRVVCSLLLHYCFYSLPLNTDRALRPARKSKHPNTLFFFTKVFS